LIGDEPADTLRQTIIAGDVMKAMLGVALSVCTAFGAQARTSDEGTIIRSRGTGLWSNPMTWEGGSVPQAGARVQIRPGHTVTYDRVSETTIRFIHVAGVLTFAADRNTQLDVGLIKIQRGEDASEDGFDCDAHSAEAETSDTTPSLLVGTPEEPIGADWKSKIRLVSVGDMDPKTCPAIVCCGGRMEFHGAKLNRSWVKLAQTVKKGDATVRLAEPVTGWRVGDHVIVTATAMDGNGRKRGTLRPGAKGRSAFTEERFITAIGDQSLSLDRPLEHEHTARGDTCGEVANLSRNVIVESADPSTGRGHTMYHRGSSGSVSYAEFRHLGKEGALGKYALHFHKVGDSMRGSSIVGASIWDSGNRWIAIHATNYLVVRDCVGYRSVGHGFYLEDGSETYNVLDRNLAVQAFAGKALPDQFLPFDCNDGAGFWWANSLNCFTRNVAVECDRYGYRYEATPDDSGRLVRPVLRADGRVEDVDIRTLPFVKFQGNEAHAQLYGMNLGEGVSGIGPDAAHPFVIKDMKIWESLWAFEPGAPSVVLDDMAIVNSRYGIYLPRYDPRVRPYGRATFKGVNLPGVLIASPTALPGEKAAIPAAIDDRPPFTIITSVAAGPGGQTIVRGTTVDDGVIARVLVNETEARPLADNFLEWEAFLPDNSRDVKTITARAVDTRGNSEPRPHVIRVR
jgi:hypothetical protein